MKASAVLFAVSGLLISLGANADDKAVDGMLRKSKCTTCHSVDKKKVGPSYKDVAAKYKGNTNAEQALYTHLTTAPEVDVGGGVKEPHAGLKGASEAEVREVARWILAK